MAVTKIHGIKSTVQASVDYICNPEKTADYQYVSTYNCSKDFASLDFKLTDDLAKFTKGDYTKSGSGNVLAYHVIQSFSEADNLTAEDCHQIGKEFADQLLEGKHEYVIATHTDTKQIHNHIIFNATSFFDLHKFKSEPYKTVAKLRTISDMLCVKNDLSVIKENDIDQYITRDTKRSIPSFKREIENRIDFILKEVTTYSEFIQQLKPMGIELDDSKQNILFRLANEGQTKNTRGTTNYTRDRIKQRITANKSNLETLRHAIEQSFMTSSSGRDYENNLKQYNVTLKKNGHEVSYELNGSVTLDDSLPLSHQLETLNNFDPLYEFTYQEKRPFFERYLEQVDDIQQADTRIKLTDKSLKHLGKEGAVIGYDVHDIFIPKHYIRTNKEKDLFVLINDKYKYHSINSGIALQGEGLIRYLDQVNNEPLNEVVIPQGAINYFTQQGVYLSFLGIDKLYIKHEDLRKVNGQLVLTVGDNWNYYGRSSGKTYERIKGVNLYKALDTYSQSVENVLRSELRTNEQRITTKRLERALNTLHTEDVSTKKNLVVTIQDLETTVSQTEHDIILVKEKMKEYNTTLKHVVSVTNNQPYINEIESCNVLQKVFLQKKYASHIAEHTHSMNILSKSGLSPQALDRSTLKDILQTNTRNLKRLERNLTDIKQRINKLSDVNRIIDQIASNRTERTYLKER